MIIKAGVEYAKVLSEIGAETFVHSHKDSAPAHEIEIYLREKYSVAAINKELSNPENIYYIIKNENEIAGFSKLELSVKHPAVPFENGSKMDQIYLSNSFHGLKLGAQLLQFNVQLSKSSNQNGMWLIVWVGNKQAITFYEKFGFNVISEGKFQLTDNHTSPCFIMVLDYANS